MKKTTSKELSKKITRYSALSLAVAGLSNAYGQDIGYHDVNPDFVGGIGDEYYLDIDGDTVNDFRIFHNNSSSLFIEPLNLQFNEVLGTYDFIVYGVPYALSASAAISNSASGTWLNGNNVANMRMSLNYGSQYIASISDYACSGGYWCDVTDKYLGLRFDISGSVHYGWVKLDVSAVGDVWVIKEYAYHKTPNTPLLAGEGTPTADIKDNVFSSVKIVALNKTIGLYNLPDRVNYKVFNMSGQSVLNGEIQSKIQVIEANTLSNGIYIVELQDADTNTVIRKKVVL